MEKFVWPKILDHDHKHSNLKGLRHDFRSKFFFDFYVCNSLFVYFECSPKYECKKSCYKRDRAERGRCKVYKARDYIVYK